MYKSVKELNRDELIELKQNYLCELYDNENKCPSWGELFEADEIIPDNEIYARYDCYAFTENDFFCNM